MATVSIPSASYYYTASPGLRVFSRDGALDIFRGDVWVLTLDRWSRFTPGLAIRTVSGLFEIDNPDDLPTALDYHLTQALQQSYTGATVWKITSSGKSIPVSYRVTYDTGTGAAITQEMGSNGTITVTTNTTVPAPGGVSSWSANLGLPSP